MKKIFVLAALFLAAFASTASADGYSRGNYQGSTGVKIPYYAKSVKPASGAPIGAVITTTGLSRGDCGHGTTGNSNVKTVCFSDGADWIAV